MLVSSKIREVLAAFRVPMQVPGELLGRLVNFEWVAGVFARFSRALGGGHGDLL